MEDALVQLQAAVAQINAHLKGSGQQVFLTTVPEIPGAQIGFAAWLPGPNPDPNPIPEHVVFNRENVSLGPDIGADENFGALMKAERETFAELAAAEGQLGAMVCTFESPVDPETGVKERTCFNTSQWTSAGAAAKWARDSPGHRRIMERIQDQSGAVFHPSVLASYGKTRGKIVYQCPGCKQMRFSATGPPPPHCAACSCSGKT